VNLERLVVASKNEDKIREVEAVLSELGLVIEIVRGLDWPEIEETEPTLEGNALLKARAVAEATGIPAVADDTGLEVDALDGAPGIFTARYSGPGATYESNVDKLLADLGDRDDRRAVFRTAVALVDAQGDELVVEGSLEGRIAYERRGAGGFGYDPVFEVDGITLAEMSQARKNRISHRAVAFHALADALSSPSTAS
jgi:XTP/dITP diphosphohydrolase